MQSGQGSPAGVPAMKATGRAADASSDGGGDVQGWVRGDTLISDSAIFNQAAVRKGTQEAAGMQQES